MKAPTILFHQDCQPEERFQDTWGQWEQGDCRLMSPIRPLSQESWQGEFHVFLHKEH